MTQVEASVLYGPEDLRHEFRDIPHPATTELQVSVRATGLCGSDLHYYHHYRNGDIIVKEPLILGHEAAGVVTAAGSEVTEFQIGDKVALEVGLPCGSCDRCSEGRYNICKELRFRSSAKSNPHFQGTLQSKINHPAAWCHKLPPNVPLQLGALLEPLGVAIHAVRRAKLPPGSKVTIFGAGAVGMLVAFVAKAQGAGSIIIADVDKGRVDFAVSNQFADHGYVVPMRRGENIDQSLQLAKELADSIGRVELQQGCAVGEADVVFECTGVPSCVQTAIYATRSGGKVMLIGMGTPVQTIPLSAAALREVDILGVFRYANTYPKGIEMISSRHSDLPDLSKLVTHSFQGLENVGKAFQIAGRTKDDSGNMILKVIVGMGEDKETKL